MYIICFVCRTAANTRKSWEKRIKQLEEMEGSKAQQKAAAEVKKKQSESKLERLKDSLKKIEDQIAKQEKPPEEKVSEDAPAEEEEVAAPTEEESVEPAQPESEEEESEEERAKRIASQWIPGQNHEDDDDHVQDAEDGDTYEAPVVDDEDILMEQPSEEQESESEIQTEEDASDQLGLLFTIKTWFQQQIARLTGKVDLQQKLQLANSKVEAAKKIFDSANSEFFSKQSDYNNLQDEKSKLEQKIAAEYGASDVYLPLSESCLETTVDKYQYQVCPFGDAYQIENGRKTRLGSWSGFEENDTVMNFANGDTCWQGPPRSIKVKLACGATDIFESVVEPSRCTYLASIKTPAFCSGDFIETLQKEISRKKDLISAATAKEEL
jgi:protein kinase C substrate 80K-H